MQQRVKTSVWARTRWPRYGFVVGLLVGIILGWIFNRVISFVFQSIFILALVIVVIALVYAWWRLRGRGGGMDPDRVTVTRTVVARPEGTREE